MVLRVRNTQIIRCELSLDSNSPLDQDRICRSRGVPKRVSTEYLRWVSTEYLRRGDGVRWLTVLEAAVGHLHIMF